MPEVTIKIEAKKEFKIADACKVTNTKKQPVWLPPNVLKKKKEKTVSRPANEALVDMVSRGRTPEQVHAVGIARDDKDLVALARDVIDGTVKVEDLPKPVVRVPVVEDVAVVEDTVVETTKEAAAAAIAEVMPEPKVAKKVAVEKPAKSDKGMSVLEVAELVLREGGQPLTSRELAEKMIASGKWSTKSDTPQVNVHAMVSRDIKANGDKSKFKKVENKFAVAC